MAEDLSRLSDAELERALVELGADLSAAPSATPSRDLSAAVIGRIGAPSGGPAEPPAAGSSGIIGPTGLALLAVGLLVAAVLAFFSLLRGAPVGPSRPPAEDPGGRQVVVYGGDLNPAERQAIEQLLDPDRTATVETATREELQAALQSAGLPTAPTDRAISSVALTCRRPDEGLQVRTQQITHLPAAAYTLALLTAGVYDATVVVAAPPTHPVTGETALVGILEASAACRAGQPLEPTRVRLAHEELRTLASLAVDAADPGNPAPLLLMAAEPVLSARATDEASLGAALDAATARAGVALDPALRAQLLALLRQLGALDHGPYRAGFQVRRLEPGDVEVAPMPH